MADASHVVLDPALQNFVAHASVAGWDEATLAYRRAIVEAEPGSAPHNEYDVPAWRIGERTKTVAVGIVLCLNLGVDPPDADVSISTVQFLGDLLVHGLKLFAVAAPRRIEFYQPHRIVAHHFVPIAAVELVDLGKGGSGSEAAEQREEEGSGVWHPCTRAGAERALTASEPSAATASEPIAPR